MPKRPAKLRWVATEYDSICETFNVAKRPDGSWCVFEYGKSYRVKVGPPKPPQWRKPSGERIKDRNVRKPSKRQYDAAVARLRRYVAFGGTETWTSVYGKTQFDSDMDKTTVVCYVTAQRQPKKAKRKPIPTRSWDAEP